MTKFAYDGGAFMYKLFSDRNKESSEEVDVYIYNSLPVPFRNQLIYIIREIIKDLNNYYSDDIWEVIHNRFCREKGLKEMDDEYGTCAEKVEVFIDYAPDVELLDFIDFAFHGFIGLAQSVGYKDPLGYAAENVENHITELNNRFQQHKLGYEFINGELIQIDSKYIHHEYIKPALNLLHTNGFEGAEEEYEKAFKALRNGDYKSAIIEAEKAFESTMKTICSKKEYPFDPDRDSAKKLIQTLKDNGFFPEYTENQLNAVAAALISGAPMVRNRTSGHGQGEEVIDIPDSYAQYVIGLVAVNIVLLVKLLTDK